MSRLLHIIENTDMRGRHESLLEQAKNGGVQVKDWKPGDIVAFLNAKKDRLVVMTMLPEKESFGLVGMYRSPHGRVPPEALEFIPKAFGGGEFSMNKAIREGLEKLLSKRGRRAE